MAVSGWQTGKIRIELDSPGIRELLLSDEVGEELERRGDAVSAAADQSYAAYPVGARDRDGLDGQPLTTSVHRTPGSKRERVTVVADHPSARNIEVKHRVLGTAMDAARG